MPPKAMPTERHPPISASDRSHGRQEPPVSYLFAQLIVLKAEQTNRQLVSSGYCHSLKVSFKAAKSQIFAD